MARRSLTAASCCMVLIALASGSISPLMAQTREKAPGIPSDKASSALVNALSRQVAFVKSFSVRYPYQFRQGKAAARVDTIAVDDLKARRE